MCYSLNATVTYITHVTELDRFFKTPLYSVNGGGYKPNKMAELLWNGQNFEKRIKIDTHKWLNDNKGYKTRDIDAHKW